MAIQPPRYIPAGIPRKVGPLAALLAFAGLVLITMLVRELQSMSTSLPMIVICAACLGCIVVVRPAIGIAAVLISAAVIKIEIGTGTGSAVVASLISATVLCAGWLVHRMLLRKRLNLLPGWLIWPIAGVIGFTLFSWIWGQATLDPRITVPHQFYRVQMAQASLIIVSVLLIVVGADLFRSRSARSLLCASIVVIGAASMFLRQFVPSGGGGYLNSQTFTTFGLFGLWFVSICWGNALVNTALKPYVRVILALLAGLWLLRSIVVDGMWVSGWLPPAVALVTITLMAGPKYVVPLIAGLGVMSIALSTYFYHLLVTSQIEEGSIGGDFGRIELWRRNIEQSQDWLVFGSGPAGYALYYITFIPDQAMSSHSNYIDVLSQLGIGGLLSFVMVLTGLLLFGLRAWKLVEDPVDRAFAACTVGALPAVMFSLWFGDWLIPFVYNQTIRGFNHTVYSWLMLAALAGLIACTRERETEDARA
jgi:hypothetical protein